jgi:hypothetical protein
MPYEAKSKLSSMQTAEPRTFWCLGIYASGSTWIFNATKKIAATLGLGEGLQSGFAANLHDLAFTTRAQIAIVKTHGMDADGAERMRAISDAIWLSVRDPRDCVTSLMLYQHFPFEDALEVTRDAAAFCLSMVEDPRITIFKYEDKFFDHRATLDRLASSIGLNLLGEDVDRIFAETRRSAVEALIGSFPGLQSVVVQSDPGHLVDLDTQWHTHHAGRTGEIGRWRKMLTPSQANAVATAAAELVRRFGYTD